MEKKLKHNCKRCNELAKKHYEWSEDYYEWSKNYSKWSKYYSKLSKYYSKLSKKFHNKCQCGYLEWKKKIVLKKIQYQQEYEAEFLK